MADRERCAAIHENGQQCRATAVEAVEIQHGSFGALELPGRLRVALCRKHFQWKRAPSAPAHREDDVDGD